MPSETYMTQPLRTARVDLSPRILPHHEDVTPACIYVVYEIAFLFSSSSSARLIPLFPFLPVIRSVFPPSSVCTLCHVIEVLTLRVLSCHAKLCGEDDARYMGGGRDTGG